MAKKAGLKLADLALPAVAIGYLRQVKDWSYEEIARRVKCDKATVWRAHTEGSTPMRHTAEAIQKLAERVWRAQHK